MRSSKRWIVMGAALAVLLIVLAVLFVKRGQSDPLVSSMATASNDVPTEAPSIAPDTIQPGPIMKSTRLPMSVETLSITGRVTDTGGSPVANARVDLIDTMYSRKRDSSVTSDPDGFYEIALPEPGWYTVVALSPDGSVSQSATHPTGAIDADFVFPRPAAIAGRVVAKRTGRPIGLFRIQVPSLIGMHTDYDPKPQRVRDRDGRFSISGIPAGVDAVLVSSQGFADTIVKFPKLKAGESRRNLEIGLEVGAELEGRIVDSFGAPVALAQVSVEDGWNDNPRMHDTSSDDGTFYLAALPPGAVRIRVKCPPQHVHVHDLILSPGRLNTTRIALREDAVVEGELRVDGILSPYQTVFLSTKTERRFSARTDQDGHFRIESVPAGPIAAIGFGDLHYSSSRVSWWRRMDVEMKDGQTTHLDLDFPGRPYARIKGAIYLAPGELMRSQIPVSVVSEGHSEVFGHSTTVTKSGRFDFWASGGRVRLKARFGQQFFNRTIQFTDREVIEQDITLFGGTTLNVTITGMDSSQYIALYVFEGKHDRDAFTLDSFSPIDPLFAASATVAGDGSATVSGLAPGIYTVFVVSADKANAGTRPQQYALSSQTLEIDAEEVVNVSIPLPR